MNDVSERTALRRFSELTDIINRKAPKQTAIWWCPDNPYERLVELTEPPFSK